jgi:two-component system chemotaxis response regulator CheY
MSVVLIVDDEPKVRELHLRWLEKEGYELREASNAADALEHVRTHGADVVVSDVSMPGQDGLWLVAMLRSQFPDVAVVLATAVDEIPGSVTLQDGVVGYLLKPLTGEKVRAAVKRAVTWRQDAAARPRAQEPSPVDLWLRGKR